MNEKKKVFLKKLGCLNSNCHPVNDELFDKYDFFDRYDLVQVKYEMLRRTQIDGWPVNKSCHTFGFSRPSFYEIKKDFAAKGINGLIPSKRGPKKPYKITRPVVQLMEKMIKKDPSIDTLHLVRLIDKNLNIQIHPRTIHRFLAKHKKKRKSPSSFTDTDKWQ
jgi:transposase